MIEIFLLLPRFPFLHGNKILEACENHRNSYTTQLPGILSKDQAYLHVTAQDYNNRVTLIGSLLRSCFSLRRGDHRGFNVLNSELASAYKTKPMLQRKVV